MNQRTTKQALTKQLRSGLPAKWQIDIFQKAKSFQRSNDYSNYNGQNIKNTITEYKNYIMFLRVSRQLLEVSSVQLASCQPRDTHSRLVFPAYQDRAVLRSQSRSCLTVNRSRKQAQALSLYLSRTCGVTEVRKMCKFAIFEDFVENSPPNSLQMSQFWLPKMPVKFRQKIRHLVGYFSVKKFANSHKKQPNWRNFATSGHTGRDSKQCALAYF